MKWLSIIIAILKIAGIAVLAVLALAVLLLLVVLLCSLKYEASGAYKDGGGVGSGFVSWLFGLIRLDFGYNASGFYYKVKIPFYKLLKIGKTPSKTVDANGTEDTRIVSAMSREKTVSSDASPEEKADNTHKAEKSAKKQKHKTEKSVHHNKKKEKGIVRKIFDTCNEYEVQRLYKPLKRFLKRFFSALGIKDADADICFGFDDPSLTGIVLGGGAAAAAFIPFRFNLSGFFEGEYLCGNGRIKGKTSILALIIPAVRMVFEKPVWNFLMKMKG